MIRLAISGYGRWGRVLVEAVQGRSQEVCFVAAVTRDPARLAGDAAGAGLRPLKSLAEALADPGIDGIVLATPHAQHAGEVALCAAAGRPVFVEKPFALTTDSARAALAAAERAGIVLAVGHNRRFLPAMQFLKRLVDTGELGRILHVEANFSGRANYAPGQWRLAPGQSPGGGLAGWGIHMIDAVIHLLGPISAVHARYARTGGAGGLEEATSALLALASGATGMLGTVTATARTFRLQLFGTAGTAEMREEGMIELVGPDGERHSRHFEKSGSERAELEAFARAIAGKAAYPVSAEEILNGVRVFEAIAHSAAAGGDGQSTRTTTAQ
jgi:predicted dehydrogenase